MKSAKSTNARAEAAPTTTLNIVPIAAKRHASSLSCAGYLRSAELTPKSTRETSRLGNTRDREIRP